MITNVADPDTPLYSRVGGLPVFLKLVAAFYAGVAEDPVLRPLYPESLAESEEHLALFLAQYFGGPPIYSQRRGHPRLRMRHLPFAIGRRERDAWVEHMRRALAATGIAEPELSEMQSYFEDAATFMINQVE
jgi:hemoglobin